MHIIYLLYWNSYNGSKLTLYNDLRVKYTFPFTPFIGALKGIVRQYGYNIAFKIIKHFKQV